MTLLGAHPRAAELTQASPATPSVPLPLGDTESINKIIRVEWLLPNIV